jgi:hypothetical protein
MTKTDDDSPAHPLLRLYELISGPADHERPWDEIRSLFQPGARLLMESVNEDGSARTREWTVAEFAAEAGDFYRRRGFWEREIGIHQSWIRTDLTQSQELRQHCKSQFILGCASTCHFHK